MLRKALIILIFISLPILAEAQVNCQFYLFDQETKTPISAAHVFLDKTAVGNFSDKNGLVSLETTAALSNEDLLITHIAYETKVLGNQKYHQLTLSDTIWLEASQIEIDELIISTKRNAKWKRRYKKFKKAFLGSDQIAGKCKILNPEVLRFDEDAGQLNVKAIAAIQIENEYLGYKIYYYLSSFHLQKDGALEYLGRSSFQPYDGKAYAQRRDAVYRSSPKYFFKNLLSNNLEASGYTISMSQELADNLIELQTPPADKLIKKLPNGQFKFFFPGFLKVINHNQNTTSTRNIGLPNRGLERGRLSGFRKIETKQVLPAVSQLSKKTAYILLNAYGNVLNSKQVEEYGYWATQRIAHQLPFEYGNDLVAHNQNDIDSISLSESTPFSLLRSLLYDENPQKKKQTLQTISSNWEPAYVPAIIEFLRLNIDVELRSGINEMLSEKTGQKHIDYYDWLEWLWKQEPMYASYYSNIKALIYEQLDTKFKTYFHDRQASALIRPDEIVWGGVQQDGIPPLRYPKLIRADQATYLADSNIIFGAYINGEAKAYPKRILAWHEFFIDTFGTDTIAGVYCTLCGTMIAYDTDQHQLGTSGFLYRSNKLMYDQATQSLWSTIEGKPVLGPLTKLDLALKPFPIVTTTWAEWKQMHPRTQVLSLETGHDRDYDEGRAYQNYFATDRLMFPVPHSDDRLDNKAEIFIIRSAHYETDPLAISIDHLRKKRWIQEKIDTTNFIVLTDDSGATRAYDRKDIVFRSFKKGKLRDTTGNEWTQNELALIGPNGETLNRLPAHNIYWFAWINSFPSTRLIR